ncbi:MAG: nuclease-related domain-containing protein [Nitrospinaceae bacterium]
MSLRDPAAVREVLLGLGPDYTVISGLVRMRPDGVDRIDHVVVSRFGLFIILEVLEAGRIICQMNALDWPIRRLGKSGVLHNPVWRNRKRTNGLEAELPGIPIHGCVVIVNAKLEGAAGPEVVLIDKLPGWFRRFRNPVLSAEQIRQAVEKLGVNRN